MREVFGTEVSVMPNGLDLDVWAPKSFSEGRGRPGEHGPLRLVSTMRLAPRKRAVPLVELVGKAARAAARRTGCACRSSAPGPRRAAWPPPSRGRGCSTWSSCAAG